MERDGGSDPTAPLVGEIVGSYRVGRRLGEGGMGMVYLAVHRVLGRHAALKVLRPVHCADPEMLGRFFDEARASSLVRHPGIVDVLDVGQRADGSAYIVMELLEGQTLAAAIRRQGQLAPATAAEIAWQIASALGAAHQRGIVHRDLKPDNVFLCPDEATRTGLRVKVLDFGIAKLAPALGPAAPRTRTGTLLGTPAYMAPEQLCNAGVDPRTDVYALGCIVYEMLSGRPPFVGEGLGEIVAGHMSLAPLSPGQLAPGLPPALEATVLRALAKRPDDRQASMSVLAAELAGIYPGQVGLASDLVQTLALAEAPTGVSDAMPPTERAAAPHGILFDTTLGGSSGESQARAIAGPASAGTLRPRSRRWLWGVGVVPVGALAVYLALGGLQPRPAPGTGPAVAPVAPTPSSLATVPVRLSATPAEAELRLDGALLSNPFEGTFPSSRESRQLVVRAPGRRESARWLTFDREVTLHVELSAAKALPAAAAGAQEGPTTAVPAATPLTLPAPAVAGAVTGPLRGRGRRSTAVRRLVAPAVDRSATRAASPSESGPPAAGRSEVRPPANRAAILDD